MLYQRRGMGFLTRGRVPADSFDRIVSIEAFPGSWSGRVLCACENENDLVAQCCDAIIQRADLQMLTRGENSHNPDRSGHDHFLPLRLSLAYPPARILSL